MICAKIIDKLMLIKIRKFFSAKDTAKRMKRQALDWVKMFPKQRPHYPTTVNQYIQFKKWAKDLNSVLTTEEMKMANTL